MLLDLDHWREIRDALAANRARTALTAFGVSWAVFMLLVMLGAGNGLRNGVSEGFSGTASNSFFLWCNITTKPWNGMQPGRWLRLHDADVQYLRKAVPEAAVIAPRAQLGGWQSGNSVTRGTKSAGLSVMGDVPEMAQIHAVRLLTGRALNPNDIAERRKVAVIGPRAQELLFEPGEQPIGQAIWVQGVAFQIVGTFKPLNSGEDSEEDANAVFVPLTTFQVAFNQGDRVGWLAVMAKPGIRVSEVEAKVLSLLQRRHDVAPDDKRAFGHWNMEEEFGKIQGVFGAIRILTWIVGLGTLSAGAIGVSNVMLVIVRERTREIGVRRSIGATPLSIMTQVILESTLLTAVAGYVGLVAGIGAVELVAKVVEKMGSTGMFRHPEVSLENGVQALVLLVVAGVLAGVIPARRAVSVRPVDALRGLA